MRALTNNTLIAISRHTNKVLKVANYIAQSEQPILLDQTFMIDETTGQKEALEFFQKDFDKTVDIIEKSHQLLSTVRADNIVEQLDNDEKDLSKIFESKYNSQRFEIELPSITLRLKQSLDKNSVRDSICQHVLEIPYSEFKDFIKNCDKIYKLNENSIETEENAIEYLSSIAYREKYDLIIQKIKDIAGDFSEYRNSLGLQNRNLIDNEITFSRSMIDSITKQSTYITKDGIEQLASFHKKSMSDVNALSRLIKENQYINAIELDADTNLKGVLDILEKTTDIKLNINREFTLKCRKLGNYNANGLYLPQHHIVAIDINNPSALIHELTHATDLSNPVLYNHKLREELIEKFKKRIDISSPEIIGRVNYYLNPNEVVARLGELSYILNKNNYQGESVDQFIDKVRHDEHVYNSNFLNIAKPIDTYLENANKYFNFHKMKPSDLLEINNYFKSYFGVNHSDLSPIYSDPIVHEQKVKTTAIKRVNEFKDSAFVKLDPTSVKKALDYNLAHNIIPFEDLFSSIACNIQMIARRKKGINSEDFQNQMETTRLMYRWVVESNDKDIQVGFIKNFFFMSLAPTAYRMPSVNLAMSLTQNEEEMNKVMNFSIAMRGINYLNGTGMSQFNSHHNRYMEELIKKSDLTFDDIFSRLDKTDVMTHHLAVSHELAMRFGRMEIDSFKSSSYLPKVIDAAREYGYFNIIETAAKTGMVYVTLNQEQAKHIEDAGLKGFISQKMTSQYTSIPRIYNQEEMLLEKNQKPSLLGTNKQEKFDFKEARRKVMEEYLKELKIAQEAQSSQKVDTKIIEKLNEKIKQDKEPIVAHEIEKEPTKPIVVNKTSQMKLF